eukprot:6677481-Pyramimonas_sp.AAC.1
MAACVTRERGIRVASKTCSSVARPPFCGWIPDERDQEPAPGHVVRDAVVCYLGADLKDLLQQSRAALPLWGELCASTRLVPIACSGLVPLSPHGLLVDLASHGRAYPSCPCAQCDRETRRFTAGAAWR